MGWRINRESHPRNGQKNSGKPSLGKILSVDHSLPAGWTGPHPAGTGPKPQNKTYYHRAATTELPEEVSFTRPKGTISIALDGGLTQDGIPLDWIVGPATKRYRDDRGVVVRTGPTRH